MISLVQRILRFLALTLIDVYRLFISPLIGKNCRFDPVCSVYAARCIETHGLLLGSWLTFRRLMRCHPFSRGGIDDPPGCERH